MAMETPPTNVVLDNFRKAAIWHVRSKLDEVLTAHLQISGILNHYHSLNGFADFNISALTARHGFWLLWLDDIENELRFPRELIDENKPIVFGDAYEPTWPQYKLFVDRVVKQGYSLSVGGGSAGLGLRLDSGVCLRDTIDDTRGSVALEDYLSQNLSFIGIPVYPSNAAAQVTAIGERGRPYLYFCLLFPARGAWHAGECAACTSPHCLYQKIEHFCTNILGPFTELMFNEIKSRIFRSAVSSVATLGDVTLTNFRQQVLDRIVGRDSGERAHILGFRTARLIETGQPDMSPTHLCARDLNDLYISTIRSDYATSEAAKNTTNSHSSIHIVDELVSQLLKRGYKHIVKELDVCHTPISISIVFKNGILDKAASRSSSEAPECQLAKLVEHQPDPLRKYKWRDLFLRAFAEALVGKLVNPSQDHNHIFTVIQARDILSEELKRCLKDLKLDSCEVALAMITINESWQLLTTDSSSLSDKKLQQRIDHEINTLPYTRRTIIRLLQRLDEMKLLPAYGKTICVCTGEPEDGTPKRPLRSNVIYKDSNHVKDCGARTVLNVKDLIKAWAGEELKFDALDAFHISNKGTDTFEIKMANLVTLTFNRSKAEGVRSGLGIEVDETLLRRVFGEKLSAMERSDSGKKGQGYDDITKRMSKCGKGGAAKQCFPCISIIANAQIISSTRGDVCHPCALAGRVMDIPLLIDPVAVDVGVNSFIVVPIRPMSEGSNVTISGLLVLGAPQREYDTAKRIGFSETQLDLVGFVADYFEAEIGIERQATIAEEERIRRREVAHLEGVEPELRNLLNELTRIRRTAERVAHRIAPAQYGLLAYDEDIIRLFRTKRKMTVYFDIRDASRNVVSTNWKTLTGSDIPNTHLGRIDLFHKASCSCERSDPLKWDPSFELWLGEGSNISRGEMPLDTIHNPENASQLKRKVWKYYRYMFSLFGASRDNALYREFARYNPTSYAQRARLFNAAKLIFQRLHFPGDERGVHFAYIAQILAALGCASGGSRKITIRDPQGKKNYIKTFKDLVEYYAKHRLCVSSKGHSSSSKCRVTAPVNEFVPALAQFVEELMPSGLQDKMAFLREIDVVWEKRQLEIKLKCKNDFPEDRLHLEEHVKNLESKQSEHGMTYAYTTIVRSLRTPPSGTPLCRFTHKHGIRWKAGIEGSVFILSMPII